MFSEAVEWNITRLYGPKKREVRFTEGDKKKADLTLAYISKLFAILTRKVESINDKAADKEKVTLSRENNEIILRKKSATIKLNKSGDGYIHVGLVDAMNKYTESILSLKVQQYPFGVHLWFNKGKALFPSTVATRLVDFISLRGLH